MTRAPEAPAHPEPPPRPTPAKKPRARKPKKPYVYPANLRNSKPRFSRCHKCGVQTLTCTWDALPLRLDPQPLSQFGELSALLKGKKTWLLANGNLFRRTTWAIQTSLNGTGGLILQPHTCDDPQPAGPAVKLPPPPAPPDATPPF